MVYYQKIKIDDHGGIESLSPWFSQYRQAYTSEEGKYPEYYRTVIRAEVQDDGTTVGDLTIKEMAWLASSPNCELCMLSHSNTEPSPCVICKALQEIPKDQLAKLLDEQVVLP